ncbi:MAG: hypothetical protein KGI53_03075, partial [Nitrospirota bacterium]|nr:hypothetical protein [Nitrospirota bacterium]
MPTFLTAQTTQETGTHSALKKQALDSWSLTQKGGTMNRILVKTLSLLLFAGVGVMTVAGETAVAFQPTAIRVDLRIEVEPSMFQGTVEVIDLSDSSMLIRTDYGRMLRLFSMTCQGLRGLNEGDRVLLEPDPEGTLTVTTMDRT